MDPQTLFAQLGALGAFAMVVWYELREQRKERREDARVTREILSEMAREMTALLEHVRMSRADNEVTPTGLAAMPQSSQAGNRGYRAPSRPRGVEVVRVPRLPSNTDED